MSRLALFLLLPFCRCRSCFANFFCSIVLSIVFCIVLLSTSFKPCHFVVLRCAYHALCAVVARAPRPSIDRCCCYKQVSGLLLSTPVETVPILVTYSAVSGGIVFHAPPLATPSASPPSVGEQHKHSGGQPETGTPEAVSERRTLDSSPAATVDEYGQNAKDKTATAAAANLEVEGGEEEEEVAVVYLENSFPGKLTAAPVSLRSTATWEGRVEEIKSSGPLVRATLTRTEVPGLAESGAERGGQGGGDGDGEETDVPGVVQVRVCLLEVGPWARRACMHACMRAPCAVLCFFLGYVGTYGRESARTCCGSIV